MGESPQRPPPSHVQYNHRRLAIVRRIDHLHLGEIDVSFRERREDFQQRHHGAATVGDDQARLQPGPAAAGVLGWSGGGLRQEEEAGHVP